MSGNGNNYSSLQLSLKNDYWLGKFHAMASQCEILMATDDEPLAAELLSIAADEAWRIEQKYSRYRDDGIVPQINSSEGNPVAVDTETAQLIDFAFQCYELSDGMFDITSGILRKAWSFKPGSTPPTQLLIESLLPFIGLKKVRWHDPDFSLPDGMQIDLGGIGKEYAVDRTLGLLLAKSDVPILVNFGGDIVCNRSVDENKPWLVCIERPGSVGEAAEFLEVRSGAIATSGSTQRYLIHQGKRYGHLLNPTTGWPIERSPLSISIAAKSCTEAGMLASLAMLQGENAEKFLEQQDAKYWVIR